MDFIEGSGPQPTPAQPPAGQPQQEMLPAGPPQQQAPPMGAPMGAGLGAVEPPPQDAPDEDASEEEQEQYKDLFMRTMAAINDIRKAPKAKKSLADQLIELMSTPNKEPHESIGAAAGTIMTQMIANAKEQKVEYLPDVIREVGMDAVYELYNIADKSGAIKNLPQEGDEGYEDVLHQSMLEAVKFYGENEINNGTVNQRAHMDELEHQMRREAESGELDDWGMEEFDVESRFGMARQLGGGKPNGS